MELLFIRHGQGEHNLDIPDRLSIKHPALTNKGKEQVQSLHSEIIFHNKDIFIVSPTKRTIETANILTEKLTNTQKYISPVVGPRVFPLSTTSRTANCDITLPMGQIIADYPDFILMQKDNRFLWDEGINTIEEERFQQLDNKMITWIKEQNAKRVFIIAHDGTITGYRQLLGEQRLTRKDFLGEAGMYKVFL
jgi:broad specificity phosphatase PhoE